ncbi:MAG: site-2 protease family protein [Anaerolineales bacterium]|nr:site-2 protease family protein [Anaerolineales bacterium]
MLGRSLPETIAILISLLIAIDVHEFAHAWMANELGDPTARYQGRLSLNPLVHLDPMGTMMMLFSVFSGFGIGWGKPVPVDPRYLRKGPRVGMGLVAAAGPISNLVLAAIVAVPIRLRLTISWSLVDLLLTVISVNIIIALFNLLPIPPLDGASILRGILSTIRAPWAYRISDAFDRIGAQGYMIFVLLILVDQILPVNILGSILGLPHSLLFRLITGF